MERPAVRKQLKRIHRLLVDSRWALEQSSGVVRNKWLKDLLFNLACRRVIMLNMLDRELGIFAMPLKPGQAARRYMTKLLSGSMNGGVPDNFMATCEEDEAQLMKELEEVMYQPGLSGSTRQMVLELVTSSRENLSDLRFLKGNLSAA
ncbi:MAG: hypothetical protein ABI599_02520 [Flavobacteriales bacterium]